MNLETYFAYVAVCSVAVVIPGPSNALILANGMRHGVRAGLLNVAGTQAGVGLMIITVAIGLTSIVSAVGHWFEWIKLAGAVYLIILGIQLFRSAGSATAALQVKAPRTGFFVQGLIVSLGNPKQLLFFGALFVVMRGARDLPLVASMTTTAAAQLHGAPLHDAPALSAGESAPVLHDSGNPPPSHAD